MSVKLLIRRSQGRSIGWRVLPSWMLPLAVAAMIIVTIATIAVLLEVVNSAGISDKASLRLDAIKIGLAAGGGTGGIFALLLQIRRQSHTEFDASEQRITDLYEKAANQLYSDKAYVQIAGIANLERLGEGYPDHRQRVVDQLCAYLRTPYTPPAGAASKDRSSPELQAANEEQQVRITAQNVITRHLRHSGNRASDSFWSNIDLNLVGACLVNFDMGACRIGAVDFTGARFEGFEIRFNGTIFTDKAIFDNALFGADCNFERSTFFGYAGFEGTIFKWAIFEAVKFTRARFNSAIFREGGIFSRAVFEHLEFYQTIFDEDADADFDKVVVKNSAGFEEASFGGRTSFRETRFSGYLTFKGAKARMGVMSSWPEDRRVDPEPFSSGWGRLTKLTEPQ